MMKFEMIFIAESAQIALVRLKTALNKTVNLGAFAPPWQKEENAKKTQRH